MIWVGSWSKLTVSLKFVLEQSSIYWSILSLWSWWLKRIKERERHIDFSGLISPSKTGTWYRSLLNMFICSFMLNGSVQCTLFSIHPLSTTNPRVGYSSRLSKVAQTSLSPAAWEYIISPVRNGSPISWTCLENLQRKASRRHPDQMP